MAMRSSSFGTVLTSAIATEEVYGVDAQKRCCAQRRLGSPGVARLLHDSLEDLVDVEEVV